MLSGNYMTEGEVAIYQCILFHRGPWRCSNLLPEAYYLIRSPNSEFQITGLVTPLRTVVTVRLITHRCTLLYNIFRCYVVSENICQGKRKPDPPPAAA
jgi:hypothetical protein